MHASISTSERLYRARRIGTTFGRVYLGIKTQQFIARRLRPPDMRQRWSRFNRQSAESIYATAIDLRGLILKGCQFLGTRADVMPPEYVEVLSRLHDRVPPKPFDVVRRTIESELGQPLDGVFASISERPLASASLAQVHEARLHDGQRVAVKVQYPEIPALVRSDLKNLRGLFKAVGVLERDFDLMPLIDELATYVPRELDFQNEADNAETVARQFAGRRDVGVPRIHRDLTTRRVLVMEFIEGIKINDVEALRAAGIDTDAVAQILVDAYCRQVLVHGFFHADPHPGNLLVQAGDAGPRLVFLDFGLSKDLPPAFRQSVVGFVLALVRGELEGMTRGLVELGFETRDGRPESLEQVARLVLEVGKRLQEQPFANHGLASHVGEEISEMVRANPIVRIPSHLVLVGRVVGLLSGLSRTLGSRVDLLRTVFPYALGSQPPAGPAPPR